MGCVDTSLIRPELAFVDVVADDACELFALLEKTYLEQGLVRESWLDAICAREGAYPTGLAFESVAVAIPHVESEHIAAPYISVIRPRDSVRFGGMGGAPDVAAQLIVNIGLVAHEDDQLAVVQALIGVFMNKTAASDILAQQTPAALAVALSHWCQECSA